MFEMSKTQAAVKGMLVIGVLFSSLVCSPAMAQELRYSWLDMSYMAQDINRTGSQTPIPGQTVDVDVTEGKGVRFRGSLGTWHNLYLFIDYGSTDIDTFAVVTNDQGVFPADPDEFDFTTIRGGVGLKFSVASKTDIYAEVAYDSLDLDFGSFAGEDFGANDKDLGGELGARTLFGDDFELSAFGRYSNHADLDLNTLEFDTGAYFGVGFGWQIMRGLSIVGEYESGEFSNWSVGFRLDLDDD
jgi:hypothetical protein